MERSRREAETERPACRLIIYAGRPYTTPFSYQMPLRIEARLRLGSARSPKVWPAEGLVGKPPAKENAEGCRCHEASETLFLTPPLPSAVSECSGVSHLPVSNLAGPGSGGVRNPAAQVGWLGG